MSFINDSFMLKTETAKRLYDTVKDLPIIDYHCHISPKMIAKIINSKMRLSSFSAVTTTSGVR